MRYHSARVVLGACLLAAASAAQAAASPTSNLDLATATNGANSAFGAASAAGTLGGPRVSLNRPAWLDSAQEPQDDGRYTMGQIFAEHHGEFMNLRQRYDPQVELRARAIPNGRIKDEPGSFDMLGYDFDAEIPALISTESYLIFGAYYGGRRYLTSSAFGTAGNGSLGGVGDETLINTGVKLGFGVFLDSNVLFEMQTNPGIWSDMDDTLHHEDFDFPSSAQFTFRTFDRFFFKLGARYNQVYEEAPWLPIVGFSWEIVEGFRFDLLAPESVEISFWPNPSTGFMLGGFVTGAEYHVHTSEAINQRANVRVQEAIAYFGIVQRMTDNFSLQARAGIVVAGDYTLTTGQAGFNEAEGMLDQTFYADVTMGINF
ncbi:MAG: hypothetical protein ACK501_08500 [Planctomycetota bacterium]|jgi:hypothetical protein